MPAPVKAWALFVSALLTRRKAGQNVDGEQNGTQENTQAQEEQEKQQVQQTTSVQVGNGGNRAGKEPAPDYEKQVAERDKKIASLEARIAEAAKTAESAKKLRAEMDELRRQGEEQRVGFELQMAGARNAKAAKALLPDYDNDIEKLKAAEPWLFGTGVAAPTQTGTTGLPNAGAASDEGATLKRWRKIAGIEGDEE